MPFRKLIAFGMSNLSTDILYSGYMGMAIRMCWKLEKRRQRGERGGPLAGYSRIVQQVVGYVVREGVFPVLVRDAEYDDEIWMSEQVETENATKIWEGEGKRWRWKAHGLNSEEISHRPLPCYVCVAYPVPRVLAWDCVILELYRLMDKWEV